MIRLTVLSIFVFSCLLFFTGKNSPAQNDFVSFADFQGHDAKGTAVKKHEAKTHIDTAALQKTFDDINLRDYLTAKKDVTVASASVTSIAHDISPITSSKKVQKTSSPKKPLVAKKIVSRKSVRYSMTLPVRRPMRTQTKTQHAKNTKNTARPPSLLASFKGFITRTTSIRAGGASATSFGHRKQATNSYAAPRKTRTASSRFKNSAKNIDPRLLTVLIKRELQRLNCYSGAVSAQWDHRIERSLETAHAPLAHGKPSLKTLTYLENKSSLKCPKTNTRIVHDTAGPKQLRTVAARRQPAFNLTSKNNKAKTPIKTAYGFIIRDRTGKVISKNTAKQTAKISDESEQNTAAERARQEYALASEGKDYSFAGSGNQQYSMRPPAYTVGMRSQTSTHDGNQPGFKKKAQPKHKRTQHKKKNNDWKKGLFAF